MVMTIAEFEKGGNEVERALIADCRAGRVCKRNGGKLPAEGDETAPTVRAALIRALALEKTSLHEAGVVLWGARITGLLDLNFAKCRGRLALRQCRFEEMPQMAQAEFAELSLQGSHLPKGLFAQGAKVAGAVFLSGVAAKGEVSLSGASIGVQLDCESSTLENPDGMALNAQTVEVAGGVFLHGIKAFGEVRLHSAGIGGQLACGGATFENARGYALNAQGMRVTGSFLFRDVASVQGWVDISSAHVDDLVDDAASWAMCNDVILNGLTYDRISGTAAPKTFAARKDWLAKGSVFNGEFLPQPYTQFAKVMRAAGHLAETRRALMGGNEAAAMVFRQQARAKRRFFRAMRQLSVKPSAERLEAAKAAVLEGKGAQENAFKAVFDRFLMLHAPWPTPSKAPTQPSLATMQMAKQDFRNQMLAGAIKARLAIVWNWTMDFALRHVVGYGHAPARSIRALFVLFLAAWIVASAAWEEGSFAPNSDVILVSQDWKDLLAKDCIVTDPATGESLAPPPGCLQNPADVWSQKNAPGMDWDSFSAAGYAADLVIPILDLGQESAWAPSKDRGFWGGQLWWGRWVFAAMGWIITALGAAAVTGIIQRNSPD